MASSALRQRLATKRRPARVRSDRRLDGIAAQLLRHAGHDDQARSPKYLAVFNAFLDAIESGLWKPGERLPSEAVIAGTLPVSLGTVQRALQTLVEHGVVTRDGPRTGRFVAGLPINANQIRNFRFLDDDGQRLLRWTGRVLSVDVTAEQGPWSAFLGEGTRCVRISRVISVNLEFQTFSQVYLPEEKFGELLTMPRSSISVPLTHMLSERFNAPTLHVNHTVSCEPFSEEAARAIGEEPGKIGIHWEIFSYSYRRPAHFYQRVYLPLNRRKLQFNETA